MKHFVYILICSDNTLYVGSTTDLKRRLKEHNSSKRGARYTKGRRPVKLVYSEPCESVGKALRREAEIKRWNKVKKLELVAQLQ